MLRKWKIKFGKAMFALKTTVEEDVLQMPKFSKRYEIHWQVCSPKRNDRKLQLLEGELLSMVQRDMTISQYFHKVKSLYQDIGDLDPQASISDTKKSRVGEVAKPYVSDRKFRRSCYNCSKKHHKTHTCWSKKKPMKGNVATINIEEKWDVEALFVAKKEMVLTTVMSNKIDYENHWIVGSSYSNHMIGDKKKLQNL
ncbi:hypothetical protein J1N35_043353 [Gossypium stocksii]|uniref:Retrotransposon gag domain-containing protein n=1 Tax=Gossypium stocksii TaxID=47602 RepID=A0A9D3U7D8_9ROSI|nr:hypothetical protein J1N35_043353 [Gossypium stocksii]